MTRFLLQVALPLFAPFAIYMTWLWYAQKRAEKHGNEPPAFTRGRAFISIIAGAVLAIASIIVLALSTGHEISDGKYISPRLEGGKVVGPEFAEEAPEDIGDLYRPE